MVNRKTTCLTFYEIIPTHLQIEFIIETAQLQNIINTLIEFKDSKLAAGVIYIYVSLIEWDGALLLVI